jgi:uncharacterized protein (TIGR03435 family)
MSIIPIVTWMLLPVQNSAAVTFSAPMSAPRAESVSTIPFHLPSEVYAAPPGHFLSLLQQQLGLRLESAKGPVQVIVVDQAERPTAN